MNTPFVQSIRNYSWKIFGNDLIAGLTVAIILLPQGMAYALLAGIPPIYGLYTGLIPLLIYPFFGTSKYLSVGPVALVSILVLSGLSKIANPFSTEFIELALLTSLIAGILQCVFSLFRLGYMVNFLSKPVLKGFVTAAGLIIIISQLRDFLGLGFQRQLSSIDTFSAICKNIHDIDQLATLMGAGSLITFFIFKKYWRQFPSAILVVILGLMAMNQLPEYFSNISTIGEIPSGLPSFSLVTIESSKIIQILPLAFIICLISFIESMAISNSLADKHGDEKVNANKELMGLGLAKVIGSFFQSFPNTGSFSRSYVNEEAGAKTGIASLIAALFLGIILVWLTDFFHLLPKTILAAIVIYSVKGLFDLSYVQKLLHEDRYDFYVFGLTFLLTLLLGIQLGVFIGIFLSLLLIVAKASKPHFAVLGKMPTPGVYRNISRFPEAHSFHKTLLFRYDADLFFGNAEHFQQSILNVIDDFDLLDYFILDMSSISSIDSTAWEAFKSIIDRLKKENTEVHLVSPKGPIRDKIKLKEFGVKIGHDHMHPNMDVALKYIGHDPNKSFVEITS